MPTLYHTQIVNSKQMKELNTRSETVKLLEKISEKSFLTSGHKLKSKNQKFEGKFYRCVVFIIQLANNTICKRLDSGTN